MQRLHKMALRSRKRLPGQLIQELPSLRCVFLVHGLRRDVSGVLAVAHIARVRDGRIESAVTSVLEQPCATGFSKSSGSKSGTVTNRVKSSSARSFVM